MNFFTKKELFGLLLIFTVLFVVSIDGFKVAERRGRDSQRKADIDAVVNGLNSFQNDFGFYPPSRVGKIVACNPIQTDVDLSGRPKNAPAPEGYEKLLLFASVCEWGKDVMADGLQSPFSPYFDKLPQDAHSSQGAGYFYLSNGNIFQIFAALESADEPGFNPGIAARGFSCGSKTCNYGRTSGDLSPAISIEDHERMKKGR